MPKMLYPTALDSVIKNREFKLGGSRALKAQNMLGRDVTHDYDIVIDFKYYDLIKGKYPESNLYKRTFPIVFFKVGESKTDIIFRQDYELLPFFEVETFKVLQWQEVYKEKLYLIDLYKETGFVKGYKKHLEDVKYMLTKIEK